MKYPMLNRWISFEKREDLYDTYRAVSGISEDVVNVTGDLARFARRLDGKTDPYSIGTFTAKECDLMLRALHNHSLIRKSRILEKSIFGTIFALWFPRESKLLKVVGTMFNTLLLILWLPVLLLGIYTFCTSYIRLTGEGLMAGFFVGLLAGMFTHEFSHASAALSYGARFYEMGVSVSILPGAYVILGTQPLKGKRWSLIQIYAAGVESNFLLGGTAFTLTAALPEYATFFYMAAMSNIILGLTNLSLVNGFDGMSVMNELLGEDNFVKRAKAIVKDKVRRKKLLNTASGTAALISCYMIVVSQIAFPLLIVLNFVEIIAIII